jgi:aryl-alcohol dehydrogenase-like predicted oxidoreductase
MPLILGGHSFISQLGNDPPVSDRDQHRLVESCLEHGMQWFDTTYQPERIALGKVLHALDRRKEANIIAWNFFTDFSPHDRPTSPEYYRSHHIEIILEQLRTDHVDCLVAIALNDQEENQRQKELLVEWMKKGYVRFLGLWIENVQITDRFRNDKTPFRFAIRPFNITTTGAAPVFAACKSAGWETIATSPFKRGWELDRIVAAASAHGGRPPEMLRPIAADLMLRYSLFQPNVDRVIIGMRKLEWIERNLVSVSKGPLTAEEHRQLQELQAFTLGKRRWWTRLRRFL